MIPNTTPTPNELYNGEMKKMKDTELRVVLVVTRATLGWVIDKEKGTRKKEDWISYYQLKEKTGRGYTALAKAIQNCIDNGWIEARDKKGNILDETNKRIGKKIYYRLGRVFLSKIEDNDDKKENQGTSSESEEVNSTSSESVITESEISESEAYKRNTNTKETDNKVTVGAKTTQKAKKTEESKKSEEKESFSFVEKLKVLENDNKNRASQVIALYWKFKGFSFDNKEQYERAYKREIRAARNLTGYSDKRIVQTMKYLERTAEDYIWKLETVHKFIDEVKKTSGPASKPLSDYFDGGEKNN